MGYLGVFIDTSLSWRHNTREIRTAALKRLETLEQVSHSARGARAAVLSIAYRTTTRPKLEYASPVWGDLSQASASLLDSVQHRCLARILGVNRLAHRSDVCVESDHPPLSVRREVQLLRVWRRLSTAPSSLSLRLTSIPARNRLKEQHRASFLERLTRLCARLNITLDQAAQLSDRDLSRITVELWDTSLQTSATFCATSTPCSALAPPPLLLVYLSRASLGLRTPQRFSPENRLHPHRRMRMW